jgi:hypothetical protein
VSELVDAVVYCPCTKGAYSAAASKNVFKFCLASYPLLKPLYHLSDLRVGDGVDPDLKFHWDTEQALLVAMDYDYPATIVRLPELGPPHQGTESLSVSGPFAAILDASRTIGIFPRDLAISPIDVLTKKLLRLVTDSGIFNFGEILEIKSEALHLTKALQLSESIQLDLASAEEWIGRLKAEKSLSLHLGREDIEELERLIAVRVVNEEEEATDNFDSDNYVLTCLKYLK